MARLLADEQFPARAVDKLRLLGHDVLTVRQIDEDKSGDGKDDKTVLEIARDLNRTVLTLNRKDFKSLHGLFPWHAGIICCVVDPHPDKQAKRIDAAIRGHLQNNQHLKGCLLSEFVNQSISGQFDTTCCVRMCD